MTVTSANQAVERLKRIAHASQFLRVLRSEDEVAEGRALGVAGRKKRIDSGYYNDHRQFAEQAIALDGGRSPAGVYVTTNPIDVALLARAENRFKE